MYLKSLELHGFKSFPEKTLLKFNSGATVIVGPNGSGKSNITDAMRWVLGELSSRNIRGSKMEDVIFAGSDDKKPMSFAEVSVTFDDSVEPRSLSSEYDEVTVTRRYYRSGDSEYYINKKKARLKDIYELFMNTGIGREGYSIIGQGKISEIISKKSDDRRGIFEESAGISKYRYKKNESQKKLAETEANMSRVGDIEKELESRIGPLERDSQKARQYLELYAQKKKTDISLWLYDTEKMRAQIEKTENDTKISAHELEMIEDSIKVTASQIERLYDQSHQNKEAARRTYEQISELNKSLSGAESENRIVIKERIHMESMLESEKKLSYTAESAACTEREKLSGIIEKLAQITREYEKSKSEFDAIFEKSEKLRLLCEEKNTKLDKLFGEQKNAENVMTDLQVRMRVLENSISSQKKRSDSITDDIKKYEDEIASLDKEAKAVTEQIDSYKMTIGDLTAANSGLYDKLSAYNEELLHIAENVNKKQAESDSLESRSAALIRMQEHFDGYNNSIKHIMNESKAGRLRGIRGPLSYLIKVEQKYIISIETTLGAALQNIVCDDEEAAKRSIESLKRNNAGRATFYPLTTVKGRERGRDYDGLEHSRGFVGWADELVSCDSEYRNIVRYLLAGVAVYDNIDSASIAAKSKGWRIRAVTLDGQQINSGGSFTGGQTKRDSGILSRNTQIEELKNERQVIVEKLSSLRTEEAKIKEKINSVNNELRSAEDKAELINTLISAEMKNFSDIDGKRKALLTLLADLKRDFASISQSSEKSEDDLRLMRENIKIQSDKITEISAQREKLAAERGESELEAEKLSQKSSEVRIRLAELTRDKEAAEISRSESAERLAEYEKDGTEHKNAIDTISGKIKEFSLLAETKLEEAEKYKAEIATFEEKRKVLEEAGDEIEKRVNELRKTEKEQNSKKDIVFISHSRNENKLTALKEEEEKLVSRLWDEYELTLATAHKFAEENDCHTLADGERTKYQSAQTELKQKIRSLGHVNIDAIDEYKEVKKRYDYIKKQLGDLRNSREDLQKILNGIEEDMKRIFLEAFGKINTYFGEVFRELFGGGHAKVTLADPENPLESGIEIEAAPPGKTIKNLNLLSGGEQAFIAIALLFALIKVNPSPFCIFDEIEAALDEVNVARVGKYVKKYTKEMQIIMISHRRGTMDIADTLYGVTMPQNGVSKVFTLDSADNNDDLLK